ELNNLLRPKDLSVFKSICIKEIYILNEDDPEVQGELNITVFSEIIEYELVNNIACLSYEGNWAGGVVILIKIKVYEIIKYSIDDSNIKVYSILNIKNKYLYLTLPKDISGLDTKALIKKKKLILRSYVEVIEPYIINKKCFYRYISIIIYLKE
ncbi:MAG: hypothetical protein ACRC68_03165, partial [Clostridium sp.]